MTKKFFEQATPQMYALNEAVKKNNQEEIERLLTEDPELINCISLPLYECALFEVLEDYGSAKTINYDLLNLLIKHGVTFDYPCTMDGDTPLEVACKNQNLPLCQFLMQHNAPVTNKACHYLLEHTTQVHYLTNDSIQTVCSIIELLGGIDKVAATVDTKGTTFREKAEHSRLLDCEGHGLPYNYMSLLRQKTLSNKIDNGFKSFLTTPITPSPLFEAQLESLRSKYSEFCSSTSRYTQGNSFIAARNICEHFTLEEVKLEESTTEEPVSSLTP